MKTKAVLYFRDSKICLTLDYNSISIIDVSSNKKAINSWQCYVVELFFYLLFLVEICNPLESVESKSIPRWFCLEISFTELPLKDNGGYLHCEAFG